jgi:MATE family multidrug resistance protein
VDIALYAQVWGTNLSPLTSTFSNTKRLSWVGMKTTDSALLGHVSAQALAAAALSDLYTMCTAVFLQGRILGVLCSSAIGAGNPTLAGIYLQVSLFVLSFLTILVFASWYLTEQVWVWFGSDATTSHMAGYYARVLAWSLPGQMAFGQLSQFFSSQRIMHPEVRAAMAALVLNLVLGFMLVLGVPGWSWTGFGFAACPMVTTVVVYVYIHVQQLHKPCFAGWNYSEITWARIWTFLDLYVPAALGVASDFWRVGIIGAIAAKLGEKEVAVFNTSYRIMWIVLIMVNALSSASGIKTSIRLGKLDHKGAKQAGETGIAMAGLVLLAIGIVVYNKMRWFGRIFTDNELFLDSFEETKLPFTLALMLMNVSVAIERIPYSMGRTKEVFWLGFAASWGAQVPAVVLLTKYWRNDLTGVYWGMTIGYLVLAILYSWVTFTSDWKHYADLARQRSEVAIL